MKKNKFMHENDTIKRHEFFADSKAPFTRIRLG